MQKILNYDVMTAFQFDNGIFWISYQDVCKYYVSIHASWNPNRFTVRKSVHGYWNKITADSNYAHNPEYLLTINHSEATSIWILLNRHISKNETEGLQCVHIYEAKSARRIYWYDENCTEVHKGIYINSPHYLVRLDVPAGQHQYILVVSTYADKDVLSFTLTGYAVVPVSLNAIYESPAEFKYNINGKFTKENAGGCANNESFKINPMYKMEIPEKTMLNVKFEMPNVTHAINIEIHRGGQRVDRYSRNIVDKAFGNKAFRQAFAYHESPIDAGVYTIVPSTFEPGQLGDYIITITSTTKTPIKVTPI